MTMEGKKICLFKPSKADKLEKSFGNARSLSKERLLMLVGAKKELSWEMCTQEMAVQDCFIGSVTTSLRVYYG